MVMTSDSPVLQTFQGVPHTDHNQIGYEILRKGQGIDYTANNSKAPVRICTEKNRVNRLPE